MTQTLDKPQSSSSPAPSGRGTKLILGRRQNLHGEPWVWLTSLGLVVGMLMIVALLSVIFWNGVRVFWPDPVARLELSDGRLLYGEVVKRQEKSFAVENEVKRATELQLYTANKDVYGIPFLYVDESLVKRRSYPKNLILVERTEYGNAIGVPISVVLASSESVLATETGFDNALRSLVREAKERREKVKKIEKTEIGKINHEMNKLRNVQKSGSSDPDIAVRQKELQASYEVLAKQARELREAQDKAVFRYRLPDGNEREASIGGILDFYYPNRLSIFERARMSVVEFFSFLVDEPREANTEGGIFPAIFGTFVMTVMMSLAVTPFGVMAAIYLREYANQGMFVRTVRIAVNNLAGVPSIVFGVFGLGFFVYFVGGSIDRLFFSSSLPTPTFGTGGILWASLTLALMTVPVVIVAAEEALAAVPRGVREGSLACGASKWQTVQRVVLPAAAPGIMTGFILSMARGAGEVAPLMLVGVVKLAPSLPIDGLAPFFHFERKFMHLGFHIYDLGFQSPDSEAAKPMVFATTLVLISLVVLLNLSAIWIRQRLRRKYATGAV